MKLAVFGVFILIVASTANGVGLGDDRAARELNEQADIIEQKKRILDSMQVHLDIATRDHDLSLQAKLETRISAASREVRNLEIKLKSALMLYAQREKADLRLVTSINKQLEIPSIIDLNKDPEAARLKMRAEALLQFRRAFTVAQQHLHVSMARSPLGDFTSEKEELARQRGFFETASSSLKREVKDYEARHSNDSTTYARDVVTEIRFIMLTQEDVTVRVYRQNYIVPLAFIGSISDSCEETLTPAGGDVEALREFKASRLRNSTSNP